MKPSPEKRPILKPALTKADYILEAIAILAIVSVWILPLLLFHNLPDTIPTHYKINGEADGWGSKTSIFILPAISLVLVTGLGILNKFPHIFNYPVRVTADNALQLYCKGTRLIRIVKVMISLLFLFIEWLICNTGGNAKLPGWLLPVILIIPAALPIVMALILFNNPPPRKS